MTLFDSLSVAAFVLAGAWALIGFYFRMSDKLEAQKDAMVTKSICDLKLIIDGFGTRLTLLERDFIERSTALVERVRAVEVAIVSTAKEIRGTKDSLSSLAKHFAGEMEEPEPTRVKEIAKEVYRVETKKPKGG